MCITDMLFVLLEEQVIADLKDFSSNFKVGQLATFSANIILYMYHGLYAPLHFRACSDGSSAAVIGTW